MDKNIFSDNFNRLISQKDIKIKDLGEKTGIRPEKLSKFRNPDDSVNPSIDDLIQLSDFFNVTIDELLGHTKEENPQSVRLDFITSILKLDEKKYFRIDIRPDGSSDLSSDTRKFLSSTRHLITFPQYTSGEQTTRGYTVHLSSPSHDYEHMYHDIIHKTLNEWFDLNNVPLHIKHLWLEDRIMRLDTLYHFDGQSEQDEIIVEVENETKDSE